MSSKGTKTRVGSAGSLGLSLLAAMGLLLWAESSRAEQLWSERAQPAAPLATVPNFSGLAAQVVPAVVSIQVEQKVRLSREFPGRGGRRGQPQQPSPFADPFDFFFHYFGPQIPREFENRALGSGFFIGSGGLILTNNHVVENADSIEIGFSLKDGTEKTLKAKVLGTAPEYDVALVQTEGNPDATITYLGDSDKMQIGDWVMAIGNPFGLSHSVSVGIISAKSRRDIEPSGREGLYDFLQTDASINPGNSGGPLVNMSGEVIGINSAINAQGQGIGFAIPINMVKSMLPQLKSHGRFGRSWLGVKIQRMTEELAQSYGLGETRGALISNVVADGPADKGGLKEGDVVLEFDGKKIVRSNDLSLFAGMAGVGKKAKLKVWRNRRETTVTVELGEFPHEEVAMGEGAERQKGELGLVVSNLTPLLQQQFDLSVSSGVVVKDVEPGGIAARAGLQPGDVIVELNGTPMRQARDFADAVRKAKSGEALRLKVNRGGDHFYLALRKP